MLKDCPDYFGTADYTGAMRRNLRKGKGRTERSCPLSCFSFPISLALGRLKAATGSRDSGNLRHRTSR